jgi:hypothetical protein
MIAQSFWMRAKVAMVSLAMGGTPLVTAGTCDSYLNSLSFYRGDFAPYYDGGYVDVYYDDYYYDDCCYDDYYYEDVVYVDGGYYYDDYYYDDYYYDDYWWWP